MARISNSSRATDRSPAQTRQILQRRRSGRSRPRWSACDRTRAVLPRLRRSSRRASLPRSPVRGRENQSLSACESGARRAKGTHADNVHLGSDDGRDGCATRRVALELGIWGGARRAVSAGPKSSRAGRRHCRLTCPEVLVRFEVRPLQARFPIPLLEVIVAREPGMDRVSRKFGHRRACVSRAAVSGVSRPSLTAQSRKESADGPP